MELTQNTTQAYTPAPGFFKRLSLFDWLYAVGLTAAMLFALQRYSAYMDYYEQGILILSAPTFIWLGWYWKPVRWLMGVLGLFSLSAIALYGGALDAANQKFLLKYLLSS